MITWYFGQTGAGKTYHASMWPISAILDGDQMRKVWPGLTHSLDDRMTQHLRIARLALMLSEQNINVVVATIMPTHDIRKAVRDILGDTDVKFIYVKGGHKVDATHPFEEPSVNEYCEFINDYQI